MKHLIVGPMLILAVTAVAIKEQDPQVVTPHA